MSSNDSNSPTPPPTDPPPAAPPPPPADTLAEPLPPPPMPGDPTMVSPPPLQREAVVLVHDRGRLALLISLATMAGVALGFTMALLAFRTDGGPGAVVEPVVATHEGCALHGSHPMWMPDIDVWHAGSQTWLGVGLEQDNGAVKVTEVMPHSPAKRAGIMKGDIIRQIDGEAVATPSQLKRAVLDHDGGDQVSIELERNGVKVTVQATLAEREGSFGPRLRIR